MLKEKIFNYIKNNPQRPLDSVSLCTKFGHNDATLEAINQLKEENRIRYFGKVNRNFVVNPTNYEKSSGIISNPT